MNNHQWIQELAIKHSQKTPCAGRQEVIAFLNDLIHLLFPDYGNKSLKTTEAIEEELNKLKGTLYTMICQNGEEDSKVAQDVVTWFFERLPEVYGMLQDDVVALYTGDPAAKNSIEVIKTYPGFLAICAYRFAHLLEQKNICFLPRMMTEYAHSQTGIDIHPGASIGRHFCIDHGTGVVIGETTQIGNHVKIYQGVTLGALSVDKNMAKVKRHPTIEDHVVIYAGATILGGETLIGHHSVIGGNVWLTRSVEPHSKIYYKASMHDETNDHTETIVFKSMAL
ncbi:MAG TPA: serine acetyltransferase [Saprospiraceae bacterium]|nr:serine acetyltransferase [Saprospiraceae bacterium]